MPIKKLTNAQATALLPAFTVGLVYDHVIIDTPGRSGRYASVGLDLTTQKNKAVLHPDDYSFLQTEIVQFFLNRPFVITEALAKARIQDVWPLADPDQSPVQGDPSALPTSQPIEF